MGLRRGKVIGSEVDECRRVPSPYKVASEQGQDDYTSEQRAESRRETVQWQHRVASSVPCCAAVMHAVVHDNQYSWLVSPLVGRHNKF